MMSAFRTTLEKSVEGGGTGCLAGRRIHSRLVWLGEREPNWDRLRVQNCGNTDYSSFIGVQFEPSLAYEAVALSVGQRQKLKHLLDLWLRWRFMFHHSTIRAVPRWNRSVSHWGAAALKEALSLGKRRDRTQMVGGGGKPNRCTSSPFSLESP